MSITTTEPAGRPDWFAPVQRPPEPATAALTALLDALAVLARDLGEPAGLHVYPDVRVVSVELHDRDQLERWRLGVDQAQEVASCEDDQLHKLIQTANARHAGWAVTLGATRELPPPLPTTPEPQERER